MKIKNYLVIILILLSFVSCNTGNGEPVPPDPYNPNQGTEESGNNNPENNSGSDQKGTVIFDNKSDYTVNVYHAFNPYVGTPCSTVAPKSTANFSIVPSDDSLGDVFWFEYLMKIGDATFPYCSEQPSSGYKYIKLSANETKTLTIDALTKCESKSAYFLLENSTTSEIRLVNSSSQMHDVVTGEVLVASGKTAVYEIAPNKTEATLGSLGLVKIKVDNEAIELPVTDSDVVAGKVYTINVNNNNNKLSASLKAISPFNVDTTKKMWNFSDSQFRYFWNDGIKPVIKPAYSKDKGSVMMGTLKADPTSIGFVRIDQYGKCSDMTPLTVWTTNITQDDLDSVILVDFVEQSDGSIVMLITLVDEMENDEVRGEDLIVAYDFEKDYELWECTIEDSLLYRNDSANKLCLLADNKVALAAGKYITPEVSENSEDPEDTDEEPVEEMAPYIALFDYTKTQNGLTFVRNEEGCKKYVMDTSFPNESQFCSTYFDGTNLYACGFTDFDAQYDQVIHNGIVYRFDADLSNPKEVCKRERCLFFTLSGNGTKWYTCGEYWMPDGTNKMLGCYISSEMIANDAAANPKYYFGAKQYTWFNQLCTYDNMIVMCGQTSENFDATLNPLPFVVAYDAQGNMLWENLSYKKWATALNVIPNTIGTYILQLTDKNNRQIHFVSADFLGNEVID